MVRGYRELEKGREKGKEKVGKEKKREEKRGRGSTGTELDVGFGYYRPLRAQGL